MYETVVWATDGSDGADAALRRARELVEPGGRLVVAHCDQRMTGRAMASPALADEDDRQAKIRRQVDELREDGSDVALVIRGGFKQPADVIAGIAADVAADVIVCGPRGLGPATGLFLGSFTQRLLHVAPCAVLAVPKREAAEEPTRESASA